MREMTRLVLIVCLTAAVLAGCSSGRIFGGHGTIRVMTFNLHHGEGTDGKFDIDRIAEVINEADADVVALQEVDRWVLRSGKTDMMSRLSDLTGMTYAFARNDDRDGGVTGNGLLTRFPILEEKSLVLDGWQAGREHAMMELVLDVGGIEMVFVNTEFDPETDDSTRVADVMRMTSEISRRAYVPAVVFGSFNADPESRCIRALDANFQDCWNAAGSGAGFTYPSASPQHRMDYVFVSRIQTPTDSKTGRSGLNAAGARVLATTGSDHLPVVIDLTIVSE